MKCNLLLFLLLLVGISFCGGQVNFTDFDYFRLALQWPNSYCMLDGHICRDQVPQYFTIDGLFPEKYSGNKSKNCSMGTVLLTDEIIARNKADLLRYWPNLSTYNFEKSKKLWKERWRKKGSCSVQTLLPEQYIKTTIHLRSKHNLNTILENADIRPNGSSYAAKRILNAVTRGTGFLADIVCEADRMGNVYLTQIHQCVDKSGKKFIDCKNLVKNCDRDPVFPGAIAPNSTGKKLNATPASLVHPSNPSVGLHA